MTLQPVVRTITLWGKDGKSNGPTKAYPSPRIINQEGQLVKDFGDMSVWRYDPYPPKEETESYFLSFHGKNGHSGGSTYRTEAEALRAVDKSRAGRDYYARKGELWREYEGKLAALNEEFEGRL